MTAFIEIDRPRVARGRGPVLGFLERFVGSECRGSAPPAAASRALRLTAAEALADRFRLTAAGAHLLTDRRREFLMFCPDRRRCRLLVAPGSPAR